MTYSDCRHGCEKDYECDQGLSRWDCNPSEGRRGRGRPEKSSLSSPRPASIAAACLPVCPTQAIFPQGPKSRRSTQVPPAQRRLVHSSASEFRGRPSPPPLANRRPRPARASQLDETGHFRRGPSTRETTSAMSAIV